MKMITGIYSANVDEKGRFLLPARMRSQLQSQELYVLPGLDENHLMIMTPAYFEDQFSAAVLDSPTAMFDRAKRSLIRRLIAPAQELTLDSAGRMNIPQQMREKYGIENRGEITLVGTGFYVEVWNTETYEKAMAEDTESLADIAEKLVEE